jgi:hypothetical protein
MALKDQLEDMSALQDESCSQTSALAHSCVSSWYVFPFLGNAW